MKDLSLAKLDEVRLALEKATTVQEVKNVRDMAIAAEVYTKQQKLGKEIQDEIGRYVSRAECKLGEMLKAGKAAGQITHDHGNQWVVPNENNPKVKLSDLGIDRKLSMRAQKLAAIPKDEFEKRLVRHVTPSKILNGDNKPAPPKEPKPRKHQYSEAEIIALYRQGVLQNEIARKTGVNFRRVSEIVLGEKIQQERAAEITPDMLKLSDRQKVERAIAQQLKKLEREFGAKLQEATWRYLENQSEKLRKEQDLAKRIMEARPGYMTRVTYRKILSCLHPDWVVDPKQKARYEEAFREFVRLEKFVLNEKESPTQFASFPKTPAEWEELKRKATAERKAKRQQKTDLKRH